MKIVCIGASYLFIHNIVSDMILTQEFEDCEIVIVDLLEEPLEIVTGACRRIAADRNSKLRISSAMDRKKALQEASFVLVAITVGGFDAIRRDMDVFRSYGFYHTVGDTIGPAALSRVLRTIPVFLDIARDMEKICPSAWLINVTNPMTAIVKAVSAYTRINIVGLCHEEQGVKEGIAALFNTGVSEVSFKSLGVNHLTFAKEITVAGSDVTAAIYDRAKQPDKPELGIAWKLGMEFLKLTGYLPLTEDKHMVEFFPYYLSPDGGFGRKYDTEPLDLQKRIDRKVRLKQLHHDVAQGRRMFEGVGRFSGENVHGIILSLWKGYRAVHTVNIPNREYCKDLKRDSVVEIKAVADKDGIRGIEIPQGEFAPHIVSILYNLNAIYDYTVEAAVYGGMEKAKLALMLDPMVRDRDVAALAPKLAEKAFRLNESYQAIGKGGRAL
jgi:alpha-galactosidase